MSHPKQRVHHLTHRHDPRPKGKRHDPKPKGKAPPGKERTGYGETGGPMREPAVGGGADAANRDVGHRTFADQERPAGQGFVRLAFTGSCRSSGGQHAAGYSRRCCLFCSRSRNSDPQKPIAPAQESGDCSSVRRSTKVEGTLRICSMSEFSGK